MNKFVGIYPPVVTPFTDGGEIDFASLDRVVDHLIDGGMHGLFVLGSTGEVAYLTDDQRVSGNDSPTQPRPSADFTDDDIAAVREVLASTGQLS